MKTESWPHQIEATNLLKEKKRLLFHHGMGCGKSKQIVDVIHDLDLMLTLIVCPKPVIPTWPDQFKKHGYKNIQVVVLDQKSTVLKARRAEAEILRCRTGHLPLVLVVNYESVWLSKLGELFMKQTWDLIVCDESHRIKSPSGKASRFMGRLSARGRHRACLTGTPMPHSPLDIYGQYRFLDPTIFGRSYLFFRSEYAVMGGYVPPGARHGVQVLSFRNLDRMSEKIYSIGHKVEKKDVLKDLPPVTHQYQHITLSEAERKAYDEMEESFVVLVDEDVITAVNGLSQLTRLQQLACGFGKDQNDNIKTIGKSKAKELGGILDGIGNDPVVVFCHFRHDLDQIHAVCTDRKCYELSGRKNELAAWVENNSENAVLAAQIQSGSEGINEMVKANYAIYYSNIFDGGKYDQSLARLDRPGQTKPVTYIHMIAKDTVEEKIYRAFRRKKNIVEQVIGFYKERT